MISSLLWEQNLSVNKPESSKKFEIWPIMVSLPTGG